METLDRKLGLTESATNIGDLKTEQALGRYAYWSTESRYDKLGENYRGSSCGHCGGSCHGDGSCGGDGD
ncbi:hypothetical protein HZC30_01485 [Candidatus Woesearchaeota archaeon]|nr:hypothetical protein [Candidatus Woesearchaeota archaeon]